jgi:hypothetical protein
MNKEPLLIGALAGVTPLLVNIVNTEADTLVSQFHIEINHGLRGPGSCAYDIGRISGVCKFRRE